MLLVVEAPGKERYRLSHRESVSILGARCIVVGNTIPVIVDDADARALMIDWPTLEKKLAPQF